MENDTDTAATALDRALRDPHAGWALGVLGAVAEFTRDLGEATAEADLDGGHGVVTARGGVRVQAGPGARLIAFEQLSRRVDSWQQGTSLCLPLQEADIGGASVVTELGPDAAALRPQDRDAILFDLGVGFPHLRACVRTADPELIALLRKGVGRGLLEPGNPAGAAVVGASPHRVFVTKFARVEVFQPIPPPDGTSPEGPHTHLLPQVLRSGRAHAATRPVPEGWVSLLDMFPAHPLHDQLGGRIAFEPARHAAFQDLLARFGLPAIAAEKQRLLRAVRAGEAPADYREAEDRHARAAARAALRQLGWTEPRLPRLAEWQAAFDRVPSDAE
ncbi:DUF6925 family protein [Roseococcus pinisoli]|uniref:Uncharacterized protein n=1 Tax=Roseococcus pinisoli TaxID=2835040 RepID=A0ABS5QEJ4_9PROT|nr:hypothetical protein [Roseococcus pinisoli]MBS7812091.1 hypothetical protein [Roseococcus pinisoli]